MCRRVHQRLPQRLDPQPRPPMRRRTNSNTIAPMSALTIRATIPTPRWMFSRGSSQSPTTAPSRPTTKSPISPKPEPCITRPASQPAMSPTRMMTRRLSFDRCIVCSPVGWRCCSGVSGILRMDCGRIKAPAPLRSQPFPAIQGEVTPNIVGADRHNNSTHWRGYCYGTK